MGIRVLICDDQALVRSGFRLILQTRPDIDVVGEAANGLEAVQLATELDPDVILLDIRMPNLDGIQATQQIVASGSQARILILTTFDLDEYVYGAIRAGASGFLLKDVQPDELTNAIRLIANGNALLGPSVTTRLLERFSQQPPEQPRPSLPATLTEREHDILRLLAKGLSNAEIAQTLYLSETTIKTHVSNLLRKLGVRDRVQAVILAYNSGLVAAPGHQPSPG